MAGSRSTWRLVRRHPKSSAIATAVLVVMVVAAQHQQSAGSAHSGSSYADASPAATASTSPITAGRADEQQATARAAASVLATLQIKGRAPKTGYSRAEPVTGCARGRR